MEDTRTRLYLAMRAALRAISKLVSFSRWTPVPFVKNIFRGTIGFPEAWWRLSGMVSVSGNRKE